MLGHLPIEILGLVLNGGPSVDLRTMRPPDPWEKRPGPYLDMRWRFAARAVCSLWRTIVEHPTPSETRTIGWRKAARQTRDGHDAESRCPKWTTGRIVCASVVAEWLKWTVSAWSPRTADQIYEWCRYMVAGTNLSRKQLIVALVASAVPGAIQHAIHVEWRRVKFTTDDQSVMAGHMYGEYNHWDDDVRGDTIGLCEVLTDIIARCAHTLAPFCVLSQHDDSIGPHCLLSEACSHGNGALVRLLLDSEPKLFIQKDHWANAAGASDPSVFVHLLDLRRQKHPRVAPLGSALTGDSQSTARIGSWFAAALNKGRWQVLSACDRYGVEFDDSVALSHAASFRRMRLMAWLWERSRRRNRQREMDLFAAAIKAIAVPARHVRCPSSAIEWLCDVAEFRPHPSAPGRTIDALVKASERTCAQSLMCILTRWPHLVCGGLDVQTLERVFVICAHGSLENVHAFLAILDRYGSEYGLAPGPGGFDGWAVLTRPLHLNHGIAFYACESTSAGIALRHVLAFMRTARRSAQGHCPLRSDVGRLRGDRYNPYATVCPCSTHPQWSHEATQFGGTNPPPAVPSIYGIDHDETLHRAPAKSAGKRTPKRIDERACSPTEPVKQLTYLMGKWCAPRPVSLDLLFPGWTRPTPGKILRLEEWVPEDDRAIEIANWLECVGLLHSDPLSTLTSLTKT